MNAGMIQTTQTSADPQLKLVKSELKVFKTRYLESLNLVTAVGWSITDDALTKYSEMLNDIELHLYKKDSLNVYFKLELFNSSSAKYILKIIKRLNKAFALGKDVKIYWSCATSNETEMMDTGIDLAGMSSFPFKISQL